MRAEERGSLDEVVVEDVEDSRARISDISLVVLARRASKAEVVVVVVEELPMEVEEGSIWWIFPGRYDRG